jgi:hypothetical protein
VIAHAGMDDGGAIGLEEAACSIIIIEAMAK